MQDEKAAEPTSILSPMQLLYSAYADDRLSAGILLREGLREYEQELVSLTDRKRDEILEVICKIYTENERSAFQEGVRVGVRLAGELVGD